MSRSLELTLEACWKCIQEHLDSLGFPSVNALEDEIRSGNETLRWDARTDAIDGYLYLIDPDLTLEGLR